MSRKKSRRRQKRILNAPQQDVAPNQVNQIEETGLPVGQKHPQELVQTEAFSGPLPPPELFAHYDQVLPGSAERILAMTESEQAHRQQWVDLAAKRESQYSFFGMFSALVVWLATIGGAIYLFSIDKDIIGSLFVLVAFAGIVKAFIQGRKPTNNRGVKSDQ